MARQTSINTYHAIVDEGLLPKARLKIYKWVYHHGPATRNEVARGIGGVPNDTSTRLKEMIAQGVVYEVRERTCSITGREVIEYDLTDELPRVLPPKNTHEMTRKQLVEEIQRLRKHIHALETAMSEKSLKRKTYRERTQRSD